MPGGKIAHTLRQNDADRRLLRRQPKAEERHRRLVQDRVRKHQYQPDEKLRRKVRQQMMPQDPARRILPSLRDTATYCWRAKLQAPPRARAARGEHQCVAATPTSSPVRPRPSAKEIKIIKIMCGTPITRSMTQLMTASTPLRARRGGDADQHRDDRADARRRDAPPSCSTDSPLSVRKSRSRPSASVPNGCARLGGSLALRKLPTTAESGMSSPQRVDGGEHRGQQGSTVPG